VNAAARIAEAPGSLGRTAPGLDAAPALVSNGPMRLHLLAALLALGACAHARRPPPPAPLPAEPPRVGFETARVEGLGFLGAHLEFRSRVENPNPTPVSVTRVEYRLDLEGARAAEGALDLSLALPPAGPTGPGLGAFHFPVELRYAAVPGMARVLALEREAQYALSGTVTFLTAGGPVRVSMAAAGRLPVPRAPGFHAEKVLLRSSSAREIVLELQLEVRNPNPFAIPPGRIGMGLHLSGREVVRADVIIPAPIEPGGKAVVPVPMRISVLKAGTAVARLLIPFTSLDASLRGEAVFEGVAVPLDLATAILPGK